MVKPEKFSFVSQPKLRMLTEEQIKIIHEKALHILENTGVHFETEALLEVLEKAGARVDFETKIVRFPPALVLSAIEKAPNSFPLYDRKGEVALVLGDGGTNYDPGSSGVRMLESDGKTARESTGQDMVNIARVGEEMKNISLLSSALTPYDIPQAIGDSYRVYLLLKHCSKPFVTGAISVEGVAAIRDLLAAASGSYEALSEKPQALLDITAIAPLRWTHVSCSNMIDTAAYGMPVQLLSVPMIGASAPATLAGCVLLHTVEALSGLTAMQILNPGHPVVYGGAPMYFDMKNLTTSLNSIETNMIGAAYAQMGKYYGLPVHTYAALSDSKANDSQAGLETAMSGLIAMLAGVDVVSGVGMLDFCNTFSLEKLVIDDEICGMAKRFERGIDFSEETLASDLIGDMGTFGEYLGASHTRKWYKKEPYFPSDVIDRKNMEEWHKKGSMTSFDHAKERVAEILEAPKKSALDAARSEALDKAWRKIAAEFGELVDEEIEKTLI